MRLLSVFGTRPEAIKLAPLLLALDEQPSIQSLVCVTGQHREMLDPILSLFGIVPNYDLRLMRENQPLNVLMGRAFQALDDILDKARPDRVLVQGDTISALVAAQAAYNRGIPVAHVEAGLRTHALDSPWPEEGNRRIIDCLSDLLFAPTPSARRNLEGERMAGQVFVTGNTGIDALRIACLRLEFAAGGGLPGARAGRCAASDARSMQETASGDRPPSRKLRNWLEEHVPCAAQAGTAAGSGDRISGSSQSGGERPGPAGAR